MKFLHRLGPTFTALSIVHYLAYEVGTWTGYPDFSVSVLLTGILCSMVAIAVNTLKKE